MFDEILQEFYAKIRNTCKKIKCKLSTILCFYIYLVSFSGLTNSEIKNEPTIKNDGSFKLCNFILKL